MFTFIEQKLKKNLLLKNDLLYLYIFKNKTCKYITAISINVYINKLQKIRKKCNNAMYTLTTIKSVNVSASLYLIWSNILLMSKSKKFSI